MELLMVRMLGDLLLPPGNVILLLLLAWWWRKRRPTLAWTVVAAATGLLLLLSLPLVSDLLLRKVEIYPPLPVGQVTAGGAGAIVVLAGGWRRGPEYGEPTINTYSLQRLRYGAWLHRRNGLPIALSGGRVSGDEQYAEAELMARLLEEDFGLSPHWVESQSRNTAENARYTVTLLQQGRVGKILLVTHAFHMPRAVQEFEGLGIEVIPAPLAFLASPDFHFRARMLLPGIKSLSHSYLALHELLGRAWYRLRYGA